MLSDSALSEMLGGMTLENGTELLPAQISIKSADEERTVLSITIYEGKNRQIRRMCEQFGLTVKLLKRESIGQLRLGKIKPGEIRFLDDDEISYLKSMCSK
jgi:23S rRNA pseudouridine2605 synthase